MAGLLVFRSLADALRNGFTVYDRTDTGGYLVRKREGNLFVMALVECPDTLSIPGEPR